MTFKLRKEVSRRFVPCGQGRNFFAAALLSSTTCHINSLDDLFCAFSSWHVTCSISYFSQHQGLATYELCCQFTECCRRRFVIAMHWPALTPCRIRSSAKCSSCLSCEWDLKSGGFRLKLRGMLELQSQMISSVEISCLYQKLVQRTWPSNLQMALT